MPCGVAAVQETVEWQPVPIFWREFKPPKSDLETWGVYVGHLEGVRTLSTSLLLRETMMRI